MSAVLREMTIADYDAVIELWKRSEGVGLNESDTRPQIGAYLTRNPGQSFVAVDEAGRIVGAVLCGNDGRRGYLHHLAVDGARRREGIGSALVRACLAALAKLEIHKCNIFVYADNDAGHGFWTTAGWTARHDLRILQRSIPPR